MSVPQAIEGGRDDRPHKCVLKAAGSSSPIFFNAEISTFEIQNPHYAIAFSFTNQLFIGANQPTGTYCSLIAISVRVIRSSPTNPEGNNNLQNEKKRKPVTQLDCMQRNSGLYGHQRTCESVTIRVHCVGVTI